MLLFELSKEGEKKANAAAGSTLAMLFRGGAMALSAIGKGVKFISDTTAGGLRKAADLVESGGNATDVFCERRSEGCTKKAMKYSGISEEEVAFTMQALQAVEAEKLEAPAEQPVRNIPKFSRCQENRARGKPRWSRSHG